MAAYGDLELLGGERLSEEVNLEENKGDNALIAACDSYRHAGLLEIVRLLVTHHIDINWNNPKLMCNALVTL